MSHTQCTPCIDNFFHNPMYYMDDPTGRGGHLSANHGHRSRATQAKNGGTLQNREDKGGGSAGLQNGEDKEKGVVRATHR
jgi:hypothetical protein